MMQCPYTIYFKVGRKVFYPRCERKHFLSGTHLHDAPVPPSTNIQTPSTVRIRWRSSNTPDYHFRYVNEFEHMGL